MTYTELVTAIQNTVESSFAKADVDRFIKQAELRIYNTVQLPSLRKFASVATVLGDRYLNAPTDLLAVDSLAVIDSGTGAYTLLLPKDFTYIREAYPAPTSTGAPKYYAIAGNQTGTETALRFLLGPTPNAAYQAELAYYYLPQSIVDAGSTWLGEHFDAALLYGSLCEAAVFLKAEQDMVAIYNDRYTQAIALLKNLGDGKQRTDQYRSGQVRSTVA